MTQMAILGNTGKDINTTLKDALKVLPLLSEEEQAKLLEELTQLETLKTKENAQLHFMDFVNKVWPTFIGGRHHKDMAHAF